MKKYIVIAGVNGAGKSTLYQTIPGLKAMPRVNTDEILKGFGDWRNIQDVMCAGKIAVRKMSEYFSQGVTFNQETTLCGKTIIQTIQKAKALGYCVEVHYIGVETPDIAKSRVALRVQRGGHGIPEADIERRFTETFVNLNKILPICDLVIFYDNTEKFRRFAIYRNGSPARISQRIPDWFKQLKL